MIVARPGASNRNVLNQTAVYGTATIIASACAGGAQVLLARMLGADGFGVFALATSLLLFASLLCEVGIFLPVARNMASVDVAEQRRVVGAGLLLYVPIGVAFSLVILGLSFGVDDLLKVHVARPLQATAALVAVYPFQQLVMRIAQGAGALHLASISTIVSQGLFVVLLAILLGLHAYPSVSATLIIQSACLLIASLLFIVLIRPRFDRVRIWAPRVLSDARRYGMNAYVGRVLSVGTYNMDVLILGAFASARSVAIYVLAGAIATTGGLPLVALSTALFGRFANEARITRGWWTATLVMTLTCTGLTFGLAGPFIRALFGSEFNGAIALVLPMALAQAFRGITSMYNSFLSARGDGQALRNTGLVLTVTNLLLNFTLIPLYGATGAAYASLGALIANSGGYAYYYRRWLRTGGSVKAELAPA